MRVREIMTANPTLCSTETRLGEVARLMIEHDCGALPLFQRDRGRQVVGIVTDRDIVCRAVAAGKNIATMNAGQVMTTPAITIGPDDEVEKAVDLMRRRLIRRLPVVDGEGLCVGIVSQADLAQRGPKYLAADLLTSLTRASHLQFA